MEKHKRLSWLSSKQSWKHKRGELNGHSKLKNEDIPKIKEMFANGMTSREIAALYKMDKTIFLDIKNGKCWSHV